MPAPIYLDYNATTPIEPAVLEAMLPYWREHFGNPSSDHAYGYAAHAAFEQARRQVAALVGAATHEVVFTGSGSEADNLALKGLVEARGAAAGQIVVSAIEHPAILATARYLERRGTPLRVLPVDADGLVRLDELAAALRAPTLLVSIMHANNEVGTIQPIAEIAALAHAHGALVHTDAAQTVGKIPVDVGALGVDLLTIAGHKLAAPKGVGALVVRGGLALEPLIHGGGQEHGLRAGTENVAYAVGLGAAALLAAERLPAMADRVAPLRDRLDASIRDRVPTVMLNGHRQQRLPNTLNLGFPGRNAAALLAAIRDQVACSTGSACHAGEAAPSPVLLAMGRAPALAAAALRLSLGWRTTLDEVELAARVIAAAANA